MFIHQVVMWGVMETKLEKFILSYFRNVSLLNGLQY